MGVQSPPPHGLMKSMFFRAFLGPPRKKHSGKYSDNAPEEILDYPWGDLRFCSTGREFQDPCWTVHNIKLRFCLILRKQLKLFSVFHSIFSFHYLTNTLLVDLWHRIQLSLIVIRVRFRINLFNLFYTNKFNMVRFVFFIDSSPTS